MQEYGRQVISFAQTNRRIQECCLDWQQSFHRLVSIQQHHHPKKSKLLKYSKISFYLWWRNINNKAESQILIKVFVVWFIWRLVVDDWTKRVKHIRVIENQIVPSNWTIQNKLQHVTTQRQWQNFKLKRDFIRLLHYEKLTCWRHKPIILPTLRNAFLRIVELFPGTGDKNP